MCAWWNLYILDGRITRVFFFILSQRNVVFFAKTRNIGAAAGGCEKKLSERNSFLQNREDGKKRALQMFGLAMRNSKTLFARMCLCIFLHYMYVSSKRGFSFRVVQIFVWTFEIFTAMCARARHFLRINIPRLCCQICLCRDICGIIRDKNVVWVCKLHKNKIEISRIFTEQIYYLLFYWHLMSE